MAMADIFHSVNSVYSRPPPPADGVCLAVDYPVYPDGGRWRTFCTKRAGHEGDHGASGMNGAPDTSWPRHPPGLRKIVKQLADAWDTEPSVYWDADTRTWHVHAEWAE